MRSYVSTRRMVHNDVIPANKNNTAKGCVLLFLTVREGLVFWNPWTVLSLTDQLRNPMEGNKGDMKQEECSETIWETHDVGCWTPQSYSEPVVSPPKNKFFLKEENIPSELNWAN